MDSTPEVNVAENGNSTEKELKNDEVTSTVTLAPNKESTSETESPAIETEQNESLDKIESTEKQVEEKSSITDASTDTIEKEIDSTEAVTDSDAKTTDPTFEELPVTDNPILIDSALKIEDDKPKVPIDVEEQDVNIEDTESGDDAEESFSEDEDPNEPATVSTESPAENHSKNETATQNESLNEKEKKDLVGKGEEGFSSDKVKSDSVQSELSLNKPTETEVKKPEEHIPVQTEFSETQTNEGVKPSDQKDFNNQIKEIISDIDINIKAQEKITQLKEQELKLIQKQNELANQIHEQQLLAQQLCDQNKLKQQQIQLEAEKKTEFDSQRFQQNGQPFQPITTQFQEPAHISKTNVDLRKIFTPATDTPEILPKNHYQQYQPRQKTISPNILPAYSDAGKHRVQLNLHQNQLIEKYSKGGVQVVKSPWEAALQTGSASSAFLEESPDQVRCPSVSSPMMYHRQSVPRDLPDATVKPSYDIGLTNNQQQHREEPYRNKSTAPIPSNPQRVLAYTPSVAQGWGGRSVELPKGLYVPKEISLSSYVPPPQKQPSFTLSQKDESTFRHMPKSNFGVSADTQFSNGRFPLSNSNPLGYTTSVPKEQHSFSSQPINNIAPQVNFNPSPLSFDKLSRYENNHDNQNQQQHLNVRQKTQVQNASPIPFGTSKCTSFNENLPRSPISWTSPIEGASPQPYNLNNASSHRQSNQGQSFNKLARGWGEVQSKQHQQTYSCQYIPPATVSRNLPYTEVPYSDF
ncbi:sterile alpha motif domain-containing protein 15 isoform X12 [Drosophila kikkawai]|uniref:Sterile alpha motif domain-containing protein 15 isoform X12 n=1 Tax=Drosophila kikkawai TaxID=30033 RepID=A0ABM4GLX5_DROKI